MRGSPALGVRDRDPELTRVQTAWLELVRVDGRLGQFVRVEYQVRGTQSEKAAMLEVSRGVYREGVAEGRGWMRQALGCESELKAA